MKMSENSVMRTKTIIFNIFVSLLCSVSLLGQSDEAVREIRKADALRRAYSFKEALDVYRKSMEMFDDTLSTADDSLLKLDVSDKMLMSENGLNMMSFVSDPKVVARHRFSADDFFLYYPLPDQVWREVPCQLDSADHQFSKALYFRDGDQVVYWSSADKDGIRNIQMSELQDSVWTAPALLNEQMVSIADEIYPMMSPDGKHLYFASEGLYGVGGYDLYVSEWDEAAGDWSVPENMGFPYSSPADDFLYADSPDGRFSVFASNRDCAEDSVWVYVIEYDDMPVRHSLETAGELRDLCALEPSSDLDVSGNVVSADIPENVDTRRYMAAMSEVRALRDSISALGMMIEEDRVRYGQASGQEEKSAIEERLLKYEMRLPAFQDSLDRASARLQEIEMEFLFNGVVIDPDRLLAEADREMVGHSENYVFTRKSFGGPLSLNMMEPAFDYTFMILDEGRFAEDSTLPDGLVYQIQLFSSSVKATVDKLKGLSPVFETFSSNKYTYRVGLFSGYNDVLANLNSVKKAGFRNAFIVAFKDGRELTVSKARALEAEMKKVQDLYEVRIVTGAAELDPAVTGGIRQQAAGKDIARSKRDDGANVYVVAPFADRDAAEKLASFVRAMGVSDVRCNVIAQ